MASGEFQLGLDADMLLLTPADDVLLLTSAADVLLRILMTAAAGMLQLTAGCCWNAPPAGIFPLSSAVGEFLVMQAAGIFPLVLTLDAGKFRLMQAAVSFLLALAADISLLTSVSGKFLLTLGAGAPFSAPQLDASRQMNAHVALLSAD